MDSAPCSPLLSPAPICQERIHGVPDIREVADTGIRLGGQVDCKNWLPSFFENNMVSAYLPSGWNPYASILALQREPLHKVLCYMYLLHIPSFPPVKLVQQSFTRVRGGSTQPNLLEALRTRGNKDNWIISDEFGVVNSPDLLVDLSVH